MGWGPVHAGAFPSPLTRAKRQIDLRALVSIIIPTYNRAHTLVRALDSVRSQTFGDWELIVVDDGSDDGTADLVADYQEPRFRYFRQPNQGVSSARNLGIRASRALWISFLDSDDYWTNGKLQAQLEALESQPEYSIVYTNEIWIRRGVRVNPRKVHQKYSGWIYRYCLPLCIISPSSILLKRELFRRRGLFDTRLPVCEDYEMWLRLSACHPILYLPQHLIVKTGGHTDQLSRSRWGLDRFRIQALIQTCQSGLLTPQQLLWTRRQIVAKATIVGNGCRKRGDSERAARYDSFAKEWTSHQSHEEVPGTAVGRESTRAH